MTCKIIKNKNNQIRKRVVHYLKTYSIVSYAEKSKKTISRYDRDPQPASITIEEIDADSFSTQKKELKRSQREEGERIR